MSLLTICQRCSRRENHWLVNEARIEVGEVNWRVMLCPDCRIRLQAAVQKALAPDGPKEQP